MAGCRSRLVLQLPTDGRWRAMSPCRTDLARFGVPLHADLVEWRVQCAARPLRAIGHDCGNGARTGGVHVCSPSDAQRTRS